MEYSSAVFTKLTEASIFTLLEIGIALFGVWYLVKRPMKNRLLTAEERARILSQWNPEPLIKEVPDDHRKLTPKVVQDTAGVYMTVDGKKCLNLATHNYLGLIENTAIQESAARTIRKYGVGSCGPRGFYGTLDVHLDLEDRLADFMQAEEAVVYSYAFSTIASAIPAYCKRGDVIFTDEMLSFAAQKGMDASRSTVYYFKHNDMEDLERLLMVQKEKSLKNVKKARRTRLFLVVESIYFNTGEMCPLPKLIELRAKYKLRMFLDETVTFGVLGATGRGITEHFNINRSEVDLIMGSLESSIGSIGGFCVGSHFIIEHQRLSGLGYCFSASCPPFLTQASIDAIDFIENDPSVLKTLSQNCSYLHHRLKDVPHLMSSGHELSPIKHLYATDLDDDAARSFLDEIVKECHENGVALTRAIYLEGLEKSKIKPSIRVTVNSRLSVQQINDFIDVLTMSTTKVTCNK